MTPEAQRIAIAEVCGKDVLGWRFYWRKHESYEWRESPTYCDKELAEEAASKEQRWGTEIGKIEEFKAPAMCPDYLNDLNAMHEAEKVLTSRQSAVFEIEVLHLTTGKEKFDYDRGDLIAVITATAAQRAEAFLRTIGKWEDDK